MIQRLTTALMLVGVSLFALALIVVALKLLYRFVLFYWHLV